MFFVGSFGLDVETHFSYIKYFVNVRFHLPKFFGRMVDHAAGDDNLWFWFALFLVVFYYFVDESTDAILHSFSNRTGVND